jgi:hypothetical protein
VQVSEIARRAFVWKLRDAECVLWSLTADLVKGWMKIDEGILEIRPVRQSPTYISGARRQHSEELSSVDVHEDVVTKRRHKRSSSL